MQPKQTPTSFNQQAVPGQGLPPVPAQPPQMPVLPPQNRMPPADKPASSVGAPERATDKPIEQWIDEAKQVLDDMSQPPYKRCEALMALRSEYQQQVLGLKPKGKAE